MMHAMLRLSNTIKCINLEAMLLTYETHTHDWFTSINMRFLCNEV